MAPAIDTGQCGIATLVDGASVKIERGSVVAYTAERNEKVTMLFRVIGIAGDDVQMIDGIPFLNGVKVEQSQTEDYAFLRPEGGNQPRCRNSVSNHGSCLADRFRETLPNGKSYDVLNITLSTGDNTPVYSVPEGHVFVLGDNRDNSNDSRFMKPSGQGFIPVERIFGIFEDF